MRETEVFVSKPFGFLFGRREEVGCVWVERVGVGRELLQLCPDCVS